MSKSKFAALSLLAGALLVPVAGHCDNEPKWGSSAQATRTPVAGSNGFYEPEKVERDGDLIRFKMYASVDPSDQKVLDEFAINCETREAATLKVSDGKREWQAPTRLFAGESLYALARELCGWGPGFWKRLAD